jgi:hypothetical protein
VARPYLVIPPPSSMWAVGHQDCPANLQASKTNPATPRPPWRPSLCCRANPGRVI